MTQSIWSSITWGLHRVYVKEFNEKHYDGEMISNIFDINFVNEFDYLNVEFSFHLPFGSL